MSPCPRGVHTTTAAVASGWSGGLGGPGPLHFESHFPACTPALPPACLQRREIMLSALKPVRALWVKQNNQSIKHFCSILRCFLPAGVGSSSFVLFGLFLFVFSLRKKQTVCLT